MTIRSQWPTFLCVQISHSDRTPWGRGRSTKNKQEPSRLALEVFKLYRGRRRTCEHDDGYWCLHLDAFFSYFNWNVGITNPNSVEHRTSLHLPSHKPLSAKCFWLNMFCRLPSSCRLACSESVSKRSPCHVIHRASFALPRRATKHT